MKFTVPGFFYRFLHQNLHNFLFLLSQSIIFFIFHIKFTFYNFSPLK